MIGRTVASITCLVLLLGIAIAPCLSQQSRPAGPAEYPSPVRFEKAIHEFETAEQQQPSPRGAIVCIGSSSMRGWHSAIQEDLAPLTIIPRGFGGSNMNDALQYADRVVIPCKPRAIVLYEGDNDIEQRIPPEKIAATFLAFVGKVHKHLPEARIYVLSIKPSIRRWKSWPQVTEANRLLAEACAKDKRLTYVDVATPMLGADGQPRKDLFQKDDLHMTRPGYVIWRDVLRPVLLKAELPFEPRAAATQSARQSGCR